MTKNSLWRALGGTPPDDVTSAPKFSEADLKNVAGTLLGENEEGGIFVHPKVKPLTSLAALKIESELQQAPPADEDAPDALKWLHDWTKLAANHSPVCVLAGTYGAGKSTLLRKFAGELIDQRSKTPPSNCPLPLYVDFREWVHRLGPGVPTLRQILTAVASNPDGSSGSAVSGADDVILRNVGENKVILLFDGLDEVLTGRSTAEGGRFIAALRSAVYPTLGKAAQGRMLMAGRHRCILESLDLEVERDSANPDISQSRWSHGLCDLLPFTNPQIDTYIDKANEGKSAAKKIDRQKIQNLRHVLAKPFYLSLLPDHYPQLVKEVAPGRNISEGHFLRVVANSWFVGDRGVKGLPPEDGLRLLGMLATAHLQRAGRAWNLEVFDSLVGRFLRADHVYLRSGSRAKLCGQLLGLGAVADPKGSRDTLTPYRDFLVATHLHTALCHGRIEEWMMGVPPPEVFKFLGQLLQLDPPDGERRTSLHTLKRILAGEDKAASLVAFRYWLWAIEVARVSEGLGAGEASEDFPVPLGSVAVNLHEADLENLEIRGKSATARLDLRGAKMQGARLNFATLQWVDLYGADLTGAEARQAKLLDVRADEAEAKGLDLAGAVWREGTAQAIDFRSATLTGCAFIRVNLTGANLFNTHTRPAAGATDVSVSQCPGQQDFPLPNEIALPKISWLTGHQRAVIDCAVSSDGAWVASAGIDGAVILWDARSGRLIRALQGLTDEVWAVAISADGGRVAAADKGGGVRIWDTRKNGEKSVAFDVGKEITHFEFSADTRWLCTSTKDGELKFWNTELKTHSLVPLGSPLPTEKGRWCALSADGQRIAACLADGSVEVWAAPELHLIQRVPAAPGRLATTCGISGYGTRAIAGRAKSTWAWLAVAGAEPQPYQHEIEPHDCALSADGQRFATTHGGGEIALWSIRTGRGDSLQIGGETKPLRCRFSPDGHELVSFSENEVIRLWNLDRKRLHLKMGAPQNWVRACGFSADGTHLITGQTDGTARIWDAETGKPTKVLRGHRGWVNDVGFSPDRKLAISADSEGAVRIWNLEKKDGEEFQNIFREHPAFVNDCSISPKGKWAVSAGDGVTQDEPGDIWIWDLVNRKKHRRIEEAHKTRVMTASFSPCGKFIASAGKDGDVKVWRRRRRKDGKPEFCIAGAHSDASPEKTGANDCVFSGDGNFLVSVGEDALVKIWDVKQKGKLVKVLPGHTSWVSGCGFSKDGKSVVSVSGDGTARVWNVETRATEKILDAHIGWLNDCGVFGQQGIERIVTGGADGTMRVWDAKEGKELFVCVSWADDTVVALRPNEEDPKNQIISASEDAWRKLSWSHFDPKEKRRRVLPVEHFGSVPTTIAPSPATLSQRA